MANVYRYLKLTKESTFKQSLITPAAMTLFAKTAQVKPIHTEIEIKEGYQRGMQRVGPGFTSAEATIETAADINQLAFFLRMALAGYIFTDGPADYHEFFSNRDFVLPSLQVIAGMDDHEAITRGAGINTLSINVSGGELNIAAGIIGSTYNKNVMMDQSLQASDFDNLGFLTFADVKVLLDDIDISCPDVKDFNININNTMSADTAMRVGSRERCLNLAGDLEVTVEFTNYRNTQKFLNAFLGSDSGTFSSTGATSHKLQFVITDPITTEEITITLPACRVTDNTYATTGNDQVDETNTFKANLGVLTANDSITEIETLIYAKLNKSLTII